MHVSQTGSDAQSALRLPRYSTLWLECYPVHIQNIFAMSNMEYFEAVINGGSLLEAFRENLFWRAYEFIPWCTSNRFYNLLFIKEAITLKQVTLHVMSKDTVAVNPIA